MVKVKPFPCIRPRVGMAEHVAALPYDVFSLSEAQEEIAKHPHSFLRIDMTEATFPYPIDHNEDAVFEKAAELLNEAIDEGIYVADDRPSYYLYRLISPEGTPQTGVVACSSIDDYLSGAIKKHEKTRAEKEYNRIRHVDELNAQTGPIFLAFRSDGAIEKVIGRYENDTPLYHIHADDGVQHIVWRINSAEDEQIIRSTFADTEALYIADGHHRAASAVKAGILRRERAGNTGQPLESDHFLSVIFPSDQLTILDYNRVVSGLNGLTADVFLAKIREYFVVEGPCTSPVKPQEKGCFGMYFDGAWYELRIKSEFASDDPVSGLDVSLLQDNLLGPTLGIEDPRTDERIDFIGGIRGLEELERRVSEDMTVAFSLYPTSIDELFAVADAGLLMPPKSTWFEPKLRSGIFIHRI